MRKDQELIIPGKSLACLDIVMQTTCSVNKNTCKNIHNHSTGVLLLLNIYALFTRRLTGELTSWLCQSRVALFIIGLGGWSACSLSLSLSLSLSCLVRPREIGTRNHKELGHPPFRFMPGREKKMLTAVICILIFQSLSFPLMRKRKVDTCKPCPLNTAGSRSICHHCLPTHICFCFVP